MLEELKMKILENKRNVNPSDWKEFIKWMLDEFDYCDYCESKDIVDEIKDVVNNIKDIVI